MTPRALIVAARNPWPSRRGDQMRALDFVRALRDLGFRVELVVSDHGSAAAHDGLDRIDFFPPQALDKLRGIGSVLRGAPLQILPFRSTGLERAVLDRMGSMGPRDLVLVQLARHRPLLERLHRGRRPEGPMMLVDLIDLLSLNFRRRAQIEGGLRGRLWAVEAQRLQHTERDVVRWADAVTLVCERDRGELIRLAPAAGNQVITTPLPVAGRPDDSATESLAGADSEVRGKACGRSLVFTGNLGYFVNDHAIRFFLEGVWPRLQAARPDLELVVAGARPGRRLRVACERAGVVLHPNPTDLREILRPADLALAPLVGGAGVPVKVLEAWSEGVPVVASEWCARGLIAQGESVQDLDATLFRVPDLSDAEGFAELVVRALEDRDAARARAEAGRDRLRRRHSFAAFREAVDELIRVGRQRDH